ncbi:flavodoxin [Lachnospiraceae bacterium ZAX-1]
MDKIYVVYWSGTGNTKTMAELIKAGIEEAGKLAEVVSVSDIKPEVLKDQSVFALGCSAMGSEVLEESEMEPFVSEVEAFAKGKKIGLFGSYGWGDGEWMRDWEERMNNAGAFLVGGEGVMANEAPDDEAQERCKSLGKALVAV